MQETIADFIWEHADAKRSLYAVSRYGAGSGAASEAGRGTDTRSASIGVAPASEAEKDAGGTDTCECLGGKTGPAVAEEAAFA